MDKIRIGVTKVGIREWLYLIALALPTLLLSIDTSVLYLTLPALSKALNANSAQQLWIMDIYGFTLAAFLMIMGKLGDLTGYRKLLINGSLAFGCASVMAAFSPTANVLIISRALMGVAGATLMPSTLAMIRNIFTDSKQRGLAISLWMSCLMTGMIIGPLIGGFMLQYFSWGSVFLLGVPIMMIVVFTGRFFLPEAIKASRGGIDFTATALFLTAILPFIYGLTEASRTGLTLLTALLIVTGIIMGAMFLKREKDAVNGLIDFKLFHDKIFSVTLFAMLSTAIVMGGIALFVAQYLQLVSGLSALQAGLWMMPQAMGMITGSLLLPFISQKIRPGIIIPAGFVISAFGLIALANVPVNHGVFLLESGFVIAIFGASPILILGTGIVIGSVPPEKAGSAASLAETGNQLGVALGVALLGSLGTFIYRVNIFKNLGQYLTLKELELTGESLVAAISWTRINRPESGQILTAMRGAYVNGFHLAAISGAVIFAILAAITASKFSQLKQLH